MLKRSHVEQQICDLKILASTWYDGYNLQNVFR